MTVSPGSQRFLAYAAGLIPFLALAWRFDFVTDDAYITYRYARNWAQGEGLVYNLGVSPPVEGYSEFLWALLMGLGIKAGAAPWVTARVLSVLAGVLLVTGCVRFMRTRVSATGLSPILGALFLGSLPPLAVWATGGMSTMPFAAAVFWLFSLTWMQDRPAAAWKLALVAGLAALLRADGAWWVASVLGPAILIGFARRARGLWLPALGGALGGALVFCAHLGWRLATYGDWLPNTARAKVGLSARALERGLDYVLHFLVVFPGVALALLLVLAARDGLRRRLLPMLLLVLSTALYAILSGGDFMAFGRFWVPALPFVAIVLAVGLEGLEQRGRRPLAAVLGLVCVASTLPAAFGQDLLPSAWRERVSFRHNTPGALTRSELDQWQRMNQQALEWVDLGRALGMVTETGDSIVYGAVGAIGFFSERFIFDRNGLVTREVSGREPLPQQTSPGHDKTVPAEFFAPYSPTILDALWFPGSAAQLERERVSSSYLHPGLKVEPLDEARSPRPECLFLTWRGEP